MGTALLLGIPSGHIEKAKSVLSANAAMFAGWSVKFVPAPRKQAEIIPRMVIRAQELAAEHDDTHVIGFSDQSNRQIAADEIKPFFRFRWFNHGLLKYLSSPDPSPFVNGLAADLREEFEWAARIKPASLASPLLLPECSFVPERKNRELWRHASAFGDLRNIDGAEKALAEFRNTQRRRVAFGTFSAYRWVDEHGRVFDGDGERHGTPPFPRGWKFSYRLEPGFHFDVTHVDGRQFSLNDVHGIINRAPSGAHLNIDPHGYVRS
jgi:hypothetical protein